VQNTAITQGIWFAKKLPQQLRQKLSLLYAD